MNDFLCFAGFAALVGGIGLVHIPAAVIAGGAILFALGCCGAINDRRARERAGLRKLLRRARRRSERERIEDRETGDA